MPRGRTSQVRTGNCRSSPSYLECHFASFFYVICLYLQHRHHTVGADEAVVKIEGTAHLMDGPAVKNIISFGNKIVPTTWMIFDNKVLPIKFAVVLFTYIVFLQQFLFASLHLTHPDPLSSTIIPAPTPAFLLDFLSVLVSNKCNGMFGIDILAKDAWSEMSIGDASVVVPSDDREGYDHNKFIPIAFAFDEGKPKFRVHNKCKRDHKHSSKPTK